MRIDKRSLLSEALTLIALIALLTAARSSLADHYYVPSGSMEYTLLLDGDPPQRGDIAVFDSPRDGTRLIKRIVAVGGDLVSVKDGLLTVNGRTFDTPIGPYSALSRFGERETLLNLEHGGGPDLPPQRVPDGMVLALGDHRGSSLDGRHWGFVDENELYGKAVAVYYRRGEGFIWQRL